RQAELPRTSGGGGHADSERTTRLVRPETTVGSHRVVQGKQRRVAHVGPQQSRARPRTATQAIERSRGGGMVRVEEIAGSSRGRSPRLGASCPRDDGERPVLITNSHFAAH